MRAASTGGISPLLAQAPPRPGYSRAFSMPNQSRNTLTSDLNRGVGAELQGFQGRSLQSAEDLTLRRVSGRAEMPPELVPQVRPPRPRSGDALFEIATRLLRTEYSSTRTTQSNIEVELPTQTRPYENLQEALPRAQAEMQGSSILGSRAQGERSVTNQSRISILERSELSAESLRSAEVSRAGRQTPFQAPSHTSSTRSVNPAPGFIARPTSSSERAYPDSAARLRGDLRIKRRIRAELDSNMAPSGNRVIEPNMAPSSNGVVEPNVIPSGNIEVELPASIRWRKLSRRIVKKRVPPAEVDQRPDNERLGPRWYGYESDEDASQLSSEITSYE